MLWENDQVVAGTVWFNFLVSPYPSPLKPVPSPKKEPENDEPDIAVASVKSTTDCDTSNDPVITTPFGKLELDIIPSGIFVKLS